MMKETTNLMTQMFGQAADAAGEAMTTGRKFQEQGSRFFTDTCEKTFDQFRTQSEKMFQDAGYPEAAAGTFTDRLLDNLVIWGNEATVRSRVAEMRQFGADEILVSVLNLPEDPAATDRTVEVLGDIARE